jgi:hypothetical protein
VKIVMVAVVLALFALPSASATLATDCVFVASTWDGQDHYSLLKDNSTLVGTQLSVVSNCDEEFTVWTDGVMRFGGFEVISFDISQSTKSIEIQSENMTIHYGNLTIFPAGSFQQIIDGEIGIKDPITLSASDLESDKAWIVMMSSIILWLCTTMIAWKVVNWYVDRYHLEEVV